MSLLHCNVTGKDCIGTECRQWKNIVNECRLRQYIGNFLYTPSSGSDTKAFIDYLEEIRPETYKKIDLSEEPGLEGLRSG